MWLRMIIAVLASIVLTGCAGGASPIVAGDGYLGLGWYVDHPPQELRISSGEIDDLHIMDVEGFGLFFANGGCCIGSTNTCSVVARPGMDFYVRLSRMEIATGKEAENSAISMIVVSAKSTRITSEKGNLR